MDARAAKLALARKKLKDHQDKKLNTSPKTTPDTNNIVINNSDTSSLSYEPPEQQRIHERTISTQIHIPETPGNQQPGTDITEILISNKRNLELQVSELQTQYASLESKYNLAYHNYELATKKIQSLENELHHLNGKFGDTKNELESKNKLIEEFNVLKTKLTDENTNYQEQLEFTKTMLTAKEAENNSLHSHLYNVQSQLDTTLLQLQQLTNGSTGPYPENDSNVREQNEYLKQKLADMEQQQKALQKGKDQITSHYEHYTNELNEQLKLVMKKNEDLSQEVQQLSRREASLVEQISYLEIRMQNLVANRNFSTDVTETPDYHNLQAEHQKLQDHLNYLKHKHEELIQRYTESVAKIQELEKAKEPSEELNISLTKLNADITSDKVAAQIATEQNIKLKQDMQSLEEAYIKMSKDKLELTEKLTAEKYLSRELTLKLADIEEKAKENEIKLKAKDGEMIRLQANYRNAEKLCEELKEKLKDIEINSDQNESNTEDTTQNVIIQDTASNADENLGVMPETNENNNNILDKKDAMKKLQDRFFKIMDEVAALSDEKHRLEHIIVQLQTETDTICEYVALYQQQRSLLKRRDEERSAQLKIFQAECSKFRNQLDELANILVKFVEDPELSLYFQSETKRIEKERVMSLIANLKANSLIDPAQKSLDFKAFYPCNCCSGKLIEV